MDFENIPMTQLRAHVLRRCLAEHYAERLVKIDKAKALLFSMHFIHGYPMGAIADACGVAEGTISRRLRRGG